MEITAAYRSHFTFQSRVDLDAKVSCHKAFMLSNQLVACLTVTGCSGHYRDLNCMCNQKQTLTVH